MFGSDTLRVLHVDDDPVVTRVTAALLEARGIEVTQLNDPLQALDRITNDGFRVVLLDVDMPGLDGLDLLKQIKQLDAGTAVIMLTGLVSLNSLLRSLRRGAAACFFKPLTDVEPLVECLNEIRTVQNRWRQAVAELSKLRLVAFNEAVST